MAPQRSTKPATNHLPLAAALLQPIEYQRLFESLPNAYIAFLPDDPIFTIVAESKEHANIALVQTSEILGKPLFDVFPDTSEKYAKTGVSELIESLRTVIKTGRPDTMDTLHYDLKQPDGSNIVKYWRVTHYPVFDSENKLSIVYQATEDITEDIIAGSKLQQTQQQLDEALSIGMIGTWLWNVAENIVIGDKNMAAMFGIDIEDAALGLPLHAFTSAMHEEDRTRVSAEIAKSLQKDDTFHSEYRTVSPDGSIHWLIARGRILRDANGNPESFPGVLFDITDRKIVENNLSYLAKASAILASSLDYKNTLQSTASLIVPTIADWCTIDILDDDNNLQLVALAHKDPAKVQWASELRKQQGPPDLDEPTGVAQVIRTGKPEFYPKISDELLKASAKTDEELQLLRELELSSVIIVPLIVDGNTVGAITLIMTGHKRSYNASDLEMAEELATRASLAMTNASLYGSAQAEIKERKRLEEALHAANEELESRVETRTLQLEETNLNLQRSNQELQDFAYVASHDLQEPLRKIQAFGNLLETEYAKELGEGKDYLARMRNAAARMSALIEDILSFSRVTTKGRSFTPVDLSQVVQEVMGDIEIRIADTQATIDVGELPVLQADAMQMRQLFQNLLSNAIKFHRPDVAPAIKIRSSITTLPGSKARVCRLEFEDNGLGFDEKYLDRIFAVFQRLHNRDAYEGTGIGLAVCRKIVERHGGTITATSKLGKGSTFIITLPMRHKKGESLL